MDKDAYYFSHDSNAFHDPKIIKLRAKHGLEGYGFYWAIIEHLRNQQNYKLLEDDLDLLAFHLNSDDSKIKQMLSTCLAIGLLVSDGHNVFSDSLLRRMDRADTIRKKRADAGSKGGKAKAKAKQNSSKTLALKESKGKEKKEKEIEKSLYSAPAIDPIKTIKPKAGKRYEFHKIYSAVKPFDVFNGNFVNAYFQATDLANGEDVVNMGAQMYVYYCKLLNIAQRYTKPAEKFLTEGHWNTDWAEEAKKELEEKGERGDTEATDKFLLLKLGEPIANVVEQYCNKGEK